MYKGKYIHTITAEDIKGIFREGHKGTFNAFKLLGTMGRLQPCDIGKQIYEQPSGHYQVENDQQLNERLNKS